MLSDEILARYDGKIEAIVEACFKGEKDSDIYCIFAEILIHCYYKNDKDSKDIILSGVEEAKKLVKRAEEILCCKVKITINGSLSTIYRQYFDKHVLIEPSTNAEKVKLLAGITRNFLNNKGIGYVE
jgi:N-acetylglucosamine kinase-like BadF-type ATPase